MGPTPEKTTTAGSTGPRETQAARELEDLGYTPRIVSSGRVHFAAGPEAIARANLWLRSADRVLVLVGSFPAADFDSLFDGTRGLPWERWIRRENAFPVGGRSVKSRLSSVPALQRSVKKAIVERLRSAHDCIALPETEPPVGVEVSLLKDTATLTLDTSGPGLNKRGYRPIAGKAALKETLAAAMIQLSFWTPGRVLLDPMCGTGTLCVEAAMIGRQIAPGLRRSFAAENWGTLPGRIWSAARDEARDRRLPALDGPIRGSDIHAGALSLARRNAEAAGVAKDVEFMQEDFRDLDVPESYGVLITNPPYGQRVGEEVGRLYRDMPLVFRRLETWSIYVLTAWKDFEQIVGRSADRRRKLYNGNIECTYYQFHGPRPPREDDPQPEPAQQQPAATPGAVQAFGGVDDKARQQADAFGNRLAKTARHLRKWPRRGITCFRLYDRDIPEVPLAVDRYEDALHIAEYSRPHDRTPARHADWLDLMADRAAEVLEVDPAKVFLKTRRRQKGLSQYERVNDVGHEKVVQEGGLRFRVNLSDYLDTGLFLDHRLTRGMFRDDARGKRVLNLFCYTGGFTVYAADGGAAETVSVDLSNTYLDWAAENLRLNGLADDRHRLERADAMGFVEGLDERELFDLAIVDPPTFSNSKATEQDWDVQAGHAELLTRLERHMSPGGVIYFSTNFRRFKLERETLEAAGLEVRNITRQTIPEDFRNQRIHSCWRLTVPY
ncbi:MAG: bifunctional 23S rRNA (guanine(2069)-N(7))-methyltransferase RlmK/23S rRNA (guanine(2445)-N(2))-methyltransferase RlmL [Phycisphaerae bacterium]